MVMSMERWKGKVAVITGASAGIGADIAEALVEKGLKVVGLARRKERVEKLSKKLQDKKGQLFAVQADVTIEQDVLNAFEWITKNVGPVHILINNAGLAITRPFLESPTENYKKVFDVNVLGLCVATREAVKIMRDNKIDGHVVHINSIAGHTIPPGAGPVFNVYFASKHAVTALTETLRQELNSIGSKIKVTSISPGYVKTEFQEVAGIDLKRYENRIPLEPEDISDAIIYVLSTPPHVQIHELMIKPILEPF